MPAIKCNMQNILIVNILVRIVTVFYINRIPCSELEYLAQGYNLIHETTTVVDHTVVYSLLLYFVTLVTSNIQLTDNIIYIIFSSLSAYYIYKIAELLFNKKTANIALIFSIFLPNLTVAVAGYSIIVVVASCLELMSMNYFLKYFNDNTKKIKINLVFSIIFAIACILIRPENLLTLIPILMFILICYTSRNIVQIRENSIILCVLLISIFAGIFLHGMYIKNKSTSDHMGIFNDKTYSYMTFIHTYSIRYLGVVDEIKARELSIPYIGTPESNNFSVLKAVVRNPLKSLENMAWNAKQALNAFGHPLFFPFYFYFFIGLILLCESMYAKSVIILGFATIVHIFPYIIFHVEIRYMQPMAIFLLMLSAFGVTYIPKHKSFIAICITSLLTFIIYLSYLQTFKMISLCNLA